MTLLPVGLEHIYTRDQIGVVDEPVPVDIVCVSASSPCNQINLLHKTCTAAGQKQLCGICMMGTAKLPITVMDLQLWISVSCEKEAAQP